MRPDVISSEFSLLPFFFFRLAVVSERIGNGVSLLV